VGEIQRGNLYGHPAPARLEAPGEPASRVLEIGGRGPVRLTAQFPQDLVTDQTALLAKLERRIRRARLHDSARPSSAGSAGPPGAQAEKRKSMPLARTGDQGQATGRTRASYAGPTG